MAKSNLRILSNIMIDDTEHKPLQKYIPGDYIGQIYPCYIDVRAIDTCLTSKQIIELKQYLVCLRCRNTCSGTCDSV
jgi:hypothetical protein